MPTYVVTGVSRGIGFEFLRLLSNNADNTVIGLVRNVAATKKRVSEELKDARGQIHILHVDLDDYDSIKNAAAETASITGGAIDYLVANAAYVPTNSEFFKTLGGLADDPKRIDQDLNKMIKTNVTGNIHLYNLFLPLILKGQTKKVICITSGLAEIGMINSMGLQVSPLYTITKAAMNVVTAKFNVEYKKDGVLFIGICPGMVGGDDALDPSQLTQEEMAAGMELVGKFCQYAPDFKGPVPPRDIVPKLVKVWEDASLEKGDGGGFLPHTGVPGKWL
ncbi:hypothetical protein VPNG_05210 [Cytospora leucostoma]|uniref:Uncharacterized protein n=1 Tax=Cytospora leucostoma TaxID=1230097 RepID=A0A423X841_9PEZI|nr:hypothetical protein VPNG_05210 [Cytospora leucostoma]